MAKRSAAQAKGASEMARLDKNRDGVVSEPEFVSGGGSAEEFRQYDTNHDGTLDGREMEARAADMVDKQEEENATALKGQHEMERMDTNKDGSAGGTDVEFDRYDTNEDGKLDGREMAKRSAAQAKGASEMARLDENRDGVVSEPEFVSGGGSAEEFRQYDTNHDGTLDGREMEARAADMVDKQEEENATALKGRGWIPTRMVEWTGKSLCQQVGLMLSLIGTIQMRMASWMVGRWQSGVLHRPRAVSYTHLTLPTKRIVCI
eukprot:TRINITY_DN18332_c0_g1_i5.p3 TRINITY_DN18332_c0_g1~~TRINITY_DN18332_c0_g1_i5.p3  ORF type:complete len:262 (-),score=67.31 TRINITY_DN18332_c0_g1_i5:1328-2113(-)